MEAKFMFLLRLKHWQLFLISWGPLSLVMTVLFVYPGLILAWFSLMFVLFLVGLTNSFAWVWVITASLSKSSPPMKFGFFRVAFWIPCIYIYSFIAFTWYNVFVEKISIVNGRVDLAITIGGGLLSLACILFGLMFTGKLIKAAELGRVPSTSEHLIESTLMVFPPLGLWLIQPRVNNVIMQGK